VDSLPRSDWAFAVVHDVAASWHDYHRIGSTRLEARPAGLLVHAAGPTDDGFRTIDIWVSENAWQRDRDRWSAPLHGLEAQLVARELHVVHLITGERVT
jgi:hypothetical protein